jgi:large repetitive protein
MKAYKRLDFNILDMHLLFVCLFVLLVTVISNQANSSFGQSEFLNSTNSAGTGNVTTQRVNSNFSNSETTNLIAFNRTINTPEDSQISILLNGSDANSTGSLILSLISTPFHGNLTTPTRVENDTLSHNGTYSLANTTYTPSQNFYGRDNFTFSVTDNTTNSSSTGSVMITVNPIDDPPG